jgi:hypothetical protein
MYMSMSDNANFRHQIGEPVCGITSVAFSVSGRLLFAGYDDFECKVSASAELASPQLTFRVPRSGTCFGAIALAFSKAMTTGSAVSE